MSAPPDALITALGNALVHLAARPFPPIPSPPSTSKRASVALIIRLTPSYAHPPPPSSPSSSSSSPPADLATFFSLPWVQHADPEVLFIKRAARDGDRWTSHIALPGGKRDADDTDDLAAAIRETWEEVGLDVGLDNNDNDSRHVLAAGNLPQRLITSSWGRKALMVLCPYIFVVTSGEGSGRLRMQPSEVASCHWVPVRSLLDARSRTVKEEDVSARFANQETGVRRWLAGAVVGKMVFSAVRLWPAESVKCAESPVARAEAPGWSAWVGDLVPGRTTYEVEPPLLLWGLTLGVLADFLDLLPPHNALDLWTYPTFTPPDVRFAVWAMSWSFRQRKRKELQEIQASRVSAVEIGLDAMAPACEGQLREGGIHGLSTGLDSGPERARLKSSAVSTMLEGYYDLVRRAIAAALLGRISLVCFVAWLVLKRRRRRL